MEKRWVLRRDLKEVSESEVRISGGRAFQSLGAATEKARSPKERRCEGMMVRRPAVDERNCLDGW